MEGLSVRSIFSGLAETNDTYGKTIVGGTITVQSGVMLDMSGCFVSSDNDIPGCC